MFETIEEITADYELPDGTVIIEEMEKIFLNRGRWTTILFRCRARTPSGDYEPKVILRRYQKRKGEFKIHGSINITPKMAPVLIETLAKWFN